MGRRFVPQHVIERRVLNKDLRIEREQRRQFPHLFAPVVECALVPTSEDKCGPVVDVTLVPEIKKTLQNVDSDQQKLDWYAADCPPIDGAK